MLAMVLLVRRCMSYCCSNRRNRLERGGRHATSAASPKIKFSKVTDDDEDDGDGAGMKSLELGTVNRPDPGNAFDINTRLNHPRKKSGNAASLGQQQQQKQQRQQQQQQ